MHLLILNYESQEFSLANNVNDFPDMNSIEKGYKAASGGLDKNEGSFFHLSINTI